MVCVKESEMRILCRIERSIFRAMCGVLVKDRRRSVDLIIMLGFSEAIDQLAMANSVRWYSHVLTR